MEYTKYTFDEVTLPFNTSWKGIAVSVSGGADSALLAFLICSVSSSNTTIHIINHIRCWKTKPWQQQNFKDVYNWLVTRFPNLTFNLHTNFISPELEWSNQGPNLTDEYGKSVSGDNMEIRSFAEYICFKENVEAYYNGVTRNPRTSLFKGMETREIERTDANKHLEILRHMNKWAFHPFRFIEKSWVVAQYRKLNIMDLFDITRSCEGEIAGVDYKTYKAGQYVPVCHTCFWCKEREWAIDQSK